MEADFYNPQLLSLFFFFFFFSDIRVSELFLEFPIYGFRDSDFIHPSTLKNFVLGTTDSHPAQ